MNIAFLTSDLMFQARVSTTCQSLGYPLLCQSKLESLVAKLAPDSDYGCVIVDLTLKGIDLPLIASAIRNALPGVPLVAYGPHVQTVELEAAEAAGFDLVLTRGQFDRDLSKILSSFQKQSN